MPIRVEGALYAESALKQQHACHSVCGQAHGERAKQAKQWPPLEANK